MILGPEEDRPREGHAPCEKHVHSERKKEKCEENRASGAGAAGGGLGPRREKNRQDEGARRGECERTALDPQPDPLGFIHSMRGEGRAAAENRGEKVGRRKKDPPGLDTRGVGRSGDRVGQEFTIEEGLRVEERHRRAEEEQYEKSSSAVCRGKAYRYGK